MKLQNALNKLNKLGLSVKQDGQFFTTRLNRYNLEFAKNGSSDDITCIRVLGINEKDDILQDYCAGVFCDNLSQAIKLASN